ncbi:MAG: AMP nucleosidase, partial [Pseudomonadota bacterium]|nr:AMP nucleosidase [Pseudomonadota bacterium]
MAHTTSDASTIVDELSRLHSRSVINLRRALAAYLTDGSVPAPGARAAGLFAYPELRLRYRGGGAARLIRAYARISVPGDYATTITCSELYRDYLT